MKKLIFLILLVNLHLDLFSQKNYSIGIDGILFNSITRNTDKLSLFRKDWGLQVGFRKNIDNDNYLSINIGASNSTRNKYNIEQLRFGYETGNLFSIKSWFIITEFAIKNFRNTNSKSYNITIAPSLGIGYNFKISKNILLRTCNNFEYQIPNKIGGAFNNLSIGVLYSFSSQEKREKF